MAHAAEPLFFPQIIAHGGGDIQGISVSNSLQALDQQYAGGVRFFEIDFNWTTDTHLVCLHDWQESLPLLFNDSGRWRSLAEFEKMTMVHGLQQLTFVGLTRWLDEHPDAYVITDVKECNLLAMDYMLAHWPDTGARIIPQAHRMDEFVQAKQKGYLRAFFTNYLAEYDHRALYAFALTRRVNAVVLWHTHAMITDFVEACRMSNIRTYVHTVNDPAVRDQVYERGVYGIYTDCLF